MMVVVMVVSCLLVQNFDKQQAARRSAFSSPTFVRPREAPAKLCPEFCIFEALKRPNPRPQPKFAPVVRSLHNLGLFRMISGQNLPPRTSGKFLAYRDLRTDRDRPDRQKLCPSLHILPQIFAYLRPKIGKFSGHSLAGASRGLDGCRY